jgi:hypothetical protein
MIAWQKSVNCRISALQLGCSQTGGPVCAFTAYQLCMENCQLSVDMLAACGSMQVVRGASGSSFSRDVAGM